MADLHWDLLFFQNKLIPSSSDEDNPHLVSDDSDENELFLKPFSDIIRDIGREQFNQENRNVPFVTPPEDELRESETDEKWETKKFSTNTSKMDPKHSSRKLSVNPERKSVRKKHSLPTSDKTTTQEVVKVVEPEKNYRIEESTFLAVKEPLSSKTRRIIHTPDGGTKRVPIEIFHIVPLTLPVDIQRKLKCESGVDLLLEQPWGIISKNDVIALTTEDPNSPFYQYAEQLQAYPEEEILVGRSDEINSSDFVVALTLAGRECLLEELKTKHQDIIDGIIKINNFPVKPWTSLGSEEEIDETQIANKRPFISYDCALRKDIHGKKPMQKFTCSEFYTEINEKPYHPVEMIRGIIMDKAIQACPSYKDMLVQTTPEIPVNSTTHFSIEMRVEENIEILKNLELDSEFLTSKVTTLFQMIDPYLTYNEDFDLYKDDYEGLARAGKQLSIYPTLPYEFLSCMFTFLGTEHKGITSSSWHPNIPGVIAVAYAKNTIAMIGDLDGNSDEENLPETDSDDENLFASTVTRTPFDNVLEKVWLSQISNLEKMHEENKRDKSLYQLSTTSLEFMKYARDMRLFQILQAKKQFLFKDDFKDLNNEEVFEYPLFEGTSKKYKHKNELNIDDILERNKFLERDYLFSDSFQWKLKGAESLNPIYMMIKEQKKLPKKYIRTFLFREIWAGDEWNFGSDLELEAIDINRDFREAGIIGLGMPLIPKMKLFLPGFTDDESPDLTKEIPWIELENREEYTEKFGEVLSSTDSEKDIGGDFFDNSPKCNVDIITLNLQRNRENSEKLERLTKKLKDEKSSGDNPVPKIPHVTDAYLSNIPWGFNLETQDFLLKEIKDIATNECKQLFKNDIDVVSECSELDFWEKDDDIDELDKLNLQHYVVIWTINDTLRPLHRLSCPFEITAVSFCPHDGNIIAGGTETGQVVIWEVDDWSAKHIQDIKISDPDDEEGFQHLRKVMSWFKRLSKVEHIPVTSLSCKKFSHTDRVIDITWLPSNIQVSTADGPIYKSSDPEAGNTMQFMSTSADGTIMFWDMKGTQLPPLKASFSAWGLHREKNFPIPEYLKKNPPVYGDLYLRWVPIIKISVAIPDCQVTAVRYHISCISPHEATYKYQKDVIEQEIYLVYLEEDEPLKPEALIGTIDGTVALINWQPTSDEVNGIKTVADGLVMNAKVLRIFNFVHDGPIIRIARHPENRDIFLTAGGHVFALWTTKRDDPLKWKKYSNLLTTFVGWTTYQASTFRVGFSNGTFEVWDLLEDGNNAKMSFPVGQGSICDFSIPRLSSPEGLVGIVDQKGLLKFYNVPKDYQVRNTTKDDTFFEKIEIENKRKQIMTEMAEKVKQEITKEKENKTVKVKNEEDDENEIEVEEEREEIKAKEVIGCKKYKEELYKWYIRRRGRVANWLDPAEKKWYDQEEEHMIQTILKNKKISMDSLELALVPLKEKEKHEAELTVKKDEIASMADKIFRKAVHDLQVSREEAYKSQFVFDTEKMDSKIIEAVMEKVEKYFGASYEEEENKMEKWVKSQKIDEAMTFGDILLRNQKVRDFWNDRRRYLSKDQRWVRELIKEELEKEGLKFSYWINHEETYKIKKYKRRLEMIDKLKKVYGDDYDPFWDLDQNEETLKTQKLTEKSLKMKYLLEKLLDILKDLDPSVKGLKKKLHKATEKDLSGIDIELLRKMVKYYVNFVKEGGIRLSTRRHKTFMDKITASLSGKDEIKVEIKIPEGSFYGKYAKDKGWIKPERTVDIFGTPKFKFKYGDSYPQPSDEEIAEPKVLCADFVKQVKGPTRSQLEREEEEESEEEILPIETTETESHPEMTEEKDIQLEDEVVSKNNELAIEESGKPEEIDVEAEEKISDKEEQVESVEQEEKYMPIEGVSKEKEETEEDMEEEPRRKSGSVRFEKLDVEQEITKTKSEDQEKEAESGKETEEEDDDEGMDMTEATKKLLDFSTLYEVIEEKKAKGEEILNIEDLSSYESIESLDSISTMADSPDHSICSDDWEPQRSNYLVETEKDLKEYFEGPPPRYEPPRRRPYFRAPHDDEPTEEWVSDEKHSSEDFGKSYLGLKTEKQDKQPE